MSKGTPSNQVTLEGDVKLSTDETIVSAHVGTNAELFPKVLDLHVDRGSLIADLTYGNGVFWNQVPSELFDVIGSDIDAEKSPLGCSIDSRCLPYKDDTFDAVVFDPPYAAGMLRNESRAGTGSHRSFSEAYTSDNATSDGSKYHDAVFDLYSQTGVEIARVLKNGGVAIVKTQDEVVANTNEFTHIQVANRYDKLALSLKDIFILIRENTPSSVNTQTQVHARKNHSYYLVFEKKDTTNP